MPNHTGFVAGTLVHTDQGLVPIELLKVRSCMLDVMQSSEFRSILCIDY